METGNVELDFTASPIFAKHAYLVKTYFIANRLSQVICLVQSQLQIVASACKGNT